MRLLYVLSALVLLATACHAAAAAGGELGVDTASAETDSVLGPVELEMDLGRLKADMAVIGATEVPGEYQWQRKKTPRVAMVSSMLLPGLGQVYNGRRWKAIIFAGLETWFLANIMFEYRQADRFLDIRDSFPPGSLPWKEADLFYNFHKDNAVTFMWWAGATWLINVLDAYIDAHLFDIRSVDPDAFEGSDKAQYVGFSVKF